MRITPLVVLLLLSSACGAGDDDGSLTECGPNGECPAGFACRGSDNKCVASGTGADASTVADARADAGIDARIDAAGGGGGDASTDASSGQTDAGLVDTMITMGPQSPTRASVVTFTFVSVP